MAKLPSMHTLRSSITTRLALTLLVISTLFTVFLVAQQTRAFYEAQFMALEQAVNSVFLVSQPGIERALWDLDVDALAAQLQGVVAVPYVVYVDLTGNDGTSLNAGTLNTDHYTKTQFALAWEGRPIGILTLTSPLDQIAADTRSHLATLITSNIAQIVSLAIVMLILVQVLISRHLIELARQTSSSALHRRREPFALNRQHRNDELDAVASALETLRRQVRLDMSRRRRAEKKLQSYQRHLESLVQESDRSLSELNQIDDFMADISMAFLQGHPDEYDQTLQRVLADAGQALDVERLVVYRNEQQCFRVVAYWTAENLDLPTPVDRLIGQFHGSNDLHQRMIHRELISYDSLAEAAHNQDAAAELLLGMGPTSLAMVSMLQQGDVYGLVTASYWHGTHHWTPHQHLLLSRFADVINPVMVQSEYVQELRSMQHRLLDANSTLSVLASTDDLTGLANRRALYDHLAMILQRATQPVGILLLDIDHFKPYNDNYGHLAGDEVLRRMGAHLKSRMRQHDDLANRFGGEEFACVVQVNNQKELQLLAERLNRSVQDMGIPHEHSPTADVITVSIGAVYHEHTTHLVINDLLNLADQALYRAKESGRNQVRLVESSTTLY